MARGRDRFFKNNQNLNGDWLFGLHSVCAALNNFHRHCQRLFLLEDRCEILADKIRHNIRGKMPQFQKISKDKLTKLLGAQAVHQGVLAQFSPLPHFSLEDLPARSKRLLILDQVTDPRNIGSILRSAAAFCVDGIIIQYRYAPSESLSLAKAACGALEIVPLVRVVNISRAISFLQRSGFWVVGMEMNAKPLDGQIFKNRHIALILGSEGNGLRPLTLKKCDDTASLTMPGVMESLNVSVAAALALYELVR